MEDPFAGFIDPHRFPFTIFYDTWEEHGHPKRTGQAANDQLSRKILSKRDLDLFKEEARREKYQNIQCKHYS